MLYAASEELHVLRGAVELGAVVVVAGKTTRAAKVEGGIEITVGPSASSGDLGIAVLEVLAGSRSDPLVVEGAKRRLHAALPAGPLIDDRRYRLRQLQQKSASLRRRIEKLQSALLANDLEIAGLAEQHDSGQ